jgi:hypothetical protein
MSKKNLVEFIIKLNAECLNFLLCLYRSGLSFRRFHLVLVLLCIIKPPLFHLISFIENNLNLNIFKYLKKHTKIDVTLKQKLFIYL